jgi:hypothetical protein
MNGKRLFILVIVSFLWLFACKTTQEKNQAILSISVVKNTETPGMKISFHKGEGFNHPSFVLWLENLDGEYIRTIYITKSYASGIFKHELVGDTIWKKTPGASLQPSALPYWTYKKGLIDGEFLVPVPDHPFVDAYSGATPEGDFELSLSTKLDSKYRIMLEVNQSWDWNKYWTNNKYPDSKAYCHSAQPSIIYAVEINDEQNTFHMNPIGHGSPTGADGKLYTDIQTLTTARQIFDKIEIEVLNN